MKYELIIGNDHWTTSESIKPIKKTEGFFILEEALTHPNKVISITKTFLAYYFPRLYEIPYCEVTPGFGTDYLNSCYKFAKEERQNSLFLYKQYMLYREKLEQSRRVLSTVEADIFAEQVDKIEEIIYKSININDNLDSFIKEVNHKACCYVVTARNKLKIKSPILYEYIMKTFTFGRLILYDPKKSKGIELSILEKIN